MLNEVICVDFTEMIFTEFFEKCQEDGKRADSVVKEMLSQLKTMKPKEIVVELMWHIRQVLNSDERVTAVNAIDKIIDFMTTVVVTAGDIEKRVAAKKGKAPNPEEEVCNETFERFAFHLLKAKFLLCDNAFVRRICCQLFSRLMASLPSDTDVSEELFTELAEAICDRLTDRSPAVRQAAARAAWRLQDPNAEDCPVATALAVMAANDHHMSCRLAAVETIHIPTLIGTPAVIARLADTCEAVRRAALKRLCHRQEGFVINVRVLSPEHVRTVLARVVCEPSAKLRQSYGQELIVRRWLDEDCRGDICSFLGLLNVDTCRDLGRRTLQFIFAAEPQRLENTIKSFTVPAFSLNGTTSITLTAERVFAWMVLLESTFNAKNKNIEELFLKLLPTCLDDEEENFDDENNAKTQPFNKAFMNYVSNYLGDLFDSPPSDDVELHSALFIGENLVAIMRQYCRTLEQMDMERVVAMINEVLSRDKVHPRFVDLLTKTACEILGNGIPAVIRVAALVSELLDPEHGSPNKTRSKAHQAPPSAEKKSFSEDPERLREMELHIASLRVRLNELRDELDEQLQLQRYEEAAISRERIDAVKEELATAIANKLHSSAPVKNLTEEEEDELSLGTQQLANQRINVVQNKPTIAERLLSVLAACLEQCRPALTVATSQSLIPEIRSIFDDFVVTAIATTNAYVRAAALRVLGQCCCIDRDIASTLHSTFIIQLQLDIETIGASATSVNLSEIHDGPIAAMRTLTDIAVRHGFEVFSSDCEVANAIAHKLKSDDAAVQRAAGEALAQLLLSGRCPRKQIPTILSRLVHFWFDADLATGRDLDPHSELLRASLAAFFRMYPTQSSGALASFAESFFPTLRMVDDENVFSKVKPHSIAMFFGQKISPITNPDLPTDLHSTASIVQLNVAYFLLNAVAEAVKKLKDRELEESDKQTVTNDEKAEDSVETKEPENDEEMETTFRKTVPKTPMKPAPKDPVHISEFIWYRVVTIASCGFITTIQINQNSKRSGRLSDLFAISEKLLKDQFEWKIPFALVKRRCRKDIENFVNKVATVLNIEPTHQATAKSQSVTVVSQISVTDNSIMSPVRNAQLVA